MFIIFSYWIQTFPFHFVVDTTLVEAVKRFSDLITTKGYEEKLKFFDFSNM